MKKIDNILCRALALLIGVMIGFVCVLCGSVIIRIHNEDVAAQEEAAYWAEYSSFYSSDDDPNMPYALWCNIADQDPYTIDSYGLYVYVDNPEDLALIFNNFVVIYYDSNPLYTYDSEYDDTDQEEDQWSI